MQAKNRNKFPYILGLDMGTNSLGWAVVECEKEERKHQGNAGYKPLALRALNSRIFLDMLVAKKKVPKNQERRAARGARNRRAYYKKRREQLVQLLIKHSLLPEDYKQAPEEKLNEIDRRYGERKAGKNWSKRDWDINEKSYCSPYAIRNFALEEKLEPYEFGRLLLHLQRRRGYFSNRGAKYVDLIKHLHLQAPEDDESAAKGDKSTMDAEEKKKKEEVGKVLKGIQKLSEKLARRTLTLGQFIWQKAQKKRIPPQRITLFEFKQERQHRGETIIDRLQFRAEREMYEKEFDLIWKRQSEFHELPDSLRNEIKPTIFHQRPLMLQKGTVGNCNIYPNKKRIAKARLEYQEFRTLQVINNIKVDEKPLTAEQRQTLLDACNEPVNASNGVETLNKKKKTEKSQKWHIPWSRVASILRVRRKQVNYDRGGADDDGEGGLPRNRTAQAINDSINSIDSIDVEAWQAPPGKDVKAWQVLGKERQASLVEDLLTIHDKKALYDRLVKHWKFACYQLGTDLEKGALGLAMNEKLDGGYGKHSLKAVKELLPYLQAGMTYYDAMEKIGHRESITKGIKEAEEDFLLKIQDVPNIANPIVQKALYEIRRVVNSIVKHYGKPAIIRMEMAREMKSSKKHRKEIESMQEANRKKNEEAEEEILKHHQENPNITLEQIRSGVRRVSPADRNKYKMWKEQGEVCPYCERSIGFNELFSGGAEIEHILPYTGFSQSYGNTVVSCYNCNSDKGKSTPYEAWGSDPDRWQRIENFAKKYFRDGKQRNILKKDHSPQDESEFVTRQLNDTRYIATATKKMLEQYGVPIDVNSGAATSELRKRLGLNNVLPRDPESGAYARDVKNVDPQTGEIFYILQYKAEREKKSREDHRHHAVDAFVIALTDRALLHAMTKAHQQEQDEKRQESRSTPKDEYDRIGRLKLPGNWPADWKNNSLNAILKKRLNATVVSHMAKRKIWGALHEDTLYGKSHFSQTLDIESMRPLLFRRVEAIARAEKDGDDDWINDDDLRAVLLGWSEKNQKLRPADRRLPQWKGKEIKKFNYQTPCITIRRELTGELLLDYVKRREWKPGKNSWIAEKSIYDSLYRWLEQHGFAGGNVDKKKVAAEVDAALTKEPPQVLNRKGKLTGTLIKRVRIAQAMTGSYVKIADSYVKPGSNHHLILFNNGKEGKDLKKKARVVTMLEAAKRASAGKPVIDKEPPKEWDGEWHYELSLCVNDMVKCLDESIFEDKIRFASEHKKTPYFRVQGISMPPKGRLDLCLRYHSISVTAKSIWGLWRILTAVNIKCEKVKPSNLGLLPDDS